MSGFSTAILADQDTWAEEEGFSPYHRALESVEMLWKSERA